MMDIGMSGNASWSSRGEAGLYLQGPDWRGRSCGDALALSAPVDPRGAQELFATAVSYQ